MNGAGDGEKRRWWAKGSAKIGGFMSHAERLVEGRKYQQKVYIYIVYI